MLMRPWSRERARVGHGLEPWPVSSAALIARKCAGKMRVVAHSSRSCVNFWSAQ